MRNRIGVALGAILLLAAFTGSTASATQGENHKTAICHRTASDSNPYVYIKVDNAALDAHLENLKPKKGPKHPARVWKSDGVWRGVPHVKGDLKNDYLATSKADCKDTPAPTNPPTDEPTTPPTDEPTTPPTDEPTTPPTDEPTAPPSDEPTVEPTPTEEPPAERANPTLPPSDTVSTSTAPSNGIPLALILLGLLTASVLVLRPHKR